MPPATMNLVDRVLDGNLFAILSEWRAIGLSYEGCARRLHSEHDIDVTAETVRKWCADLGVPAPKRGVA